MTFEGKIAPTQEVLKQCGLAPLVPKGRDGLAILNGVSAMTGIGLVNLVLAKRLLKWSTTASSLIFELVQGSLDPIHPDLNERKLHPGQRAIAAEMQNILSDSQCTRSHPMRLDAHKTDNGKFETRVQEHYSVRCVPQILGPIHDTIEYATEVLCNELNSVSDNPVLIAESDTILHGGNFHGDYVALEMDKLKIAIVKLSMLCERQLDFL